MNFTEAVKQMECGDKVRRKSWGQPTRYIKLSDKSETDSGWFFIDQDNHLYSIYASEIIDVDDWEIYNPKPTLNPCHCGLSDVCFCEEEVDGKVMFYAQCSGCGMRTGYTYDEEGSARIWNSAHPAVENPNKEIKVGDWILFKTADGKTRCSKVEKVCDDYVVTSLCDVLKGHILGVAVVETTTEKKRTNYEALFLPWLQEGEFSVSKTKSVCCFIRENVLMSEEECRLTPCKECYKRFAAWLQQEYKEEVKV